MQNEVAAGDGVRPARVTGQIRRHEMQRVPGLLTRAAEYGPHFGFAIEGPHGRAHEVALLEQMEDAVHAYEARPAGDENGRLDHEVSRAASIAGAFDVVRS